MLTLLIGKDWTVNRDKILDMISRDVAEEKPGRILIVPELISHETERRLCLAAGDTASRFAEVLTFTRLVKRVSAESGHGVPECLDNGGRLVAMAAATRQLHSVLKAYAAVETKPAFLTGILDAVDEFKRCCISPKDLLAASKKTEGSFAQKLEELSLILEAYDAICANGKCDPRDQMTWLLEHLEDSEFAQNHTFYIDGFPDYTRQHMEILKHLIANAEQVTVSLTCDEVDSDAPAFEKAGSTAGELLRFAGSVGIRVQIISCDEKRRAVMPLLNQLFRGNITEQVPCLTVCKAESINQECHAAAERILELVSSGCRFRDIGVVCADFSGYRQLLEMILNRYHIPVYQSGTEDILSKTVIITVLSAIDAAVGGFEQQDVLRYLRSALSPLDVDMCDKLENYAIVWNINGHRWSENWEYHPDGLGCEWNQEAKAYLDMLNEARKAGLDPLCSLAERMQQAGTLGQLVDALYAFLDDLHLADRLSTLAVDMQQRGDLRNYQILEQLWEILLSALEQLSAMLGDTKWDCRTFTKLLKLLLSQYDVGTIPAVLDAVAVGSVSAMRCGQVKHLLVLGASEGNLPGYSGSVSVLSDQERTALRSLGLPLTGGAIEGLQAEFAEIYGVFCGADASIYVSCGEGQPSFLYRRLCAMTDGAVDASPLGVAGGDKLEAGAYLVRSADKKTAESLDLQEQYAFLKGRTLHDIGSMSEDVVRGLYGDRLNLSASQVDKLADCRMAYFLKYGLKLKERKPATVDPAEFGTYVHAVLEETGRHIKQLGGFKKVSLEETLRIAGEYSQDYITRRFSQIDSERVSYLFQRNIQELELVVRELWEELQESEFAPAEFELAFGSNAEMPAIPIHSHSISAQLRGFVDRVDVWENEGQTYFRVVDYKTGKKDFDYCDIFNGLGLQMLLYLFVLEENGTDRLSENPVAAGVQYFPARVPLVSTDGRPDEASVKAERDKCWKRKGLVLAEEAVLSAMESNEQPKRLPCTKKKDGTFSGDLASRSQFALLKGYVFALLGKMVDDIASGCVAPNPYTRGGRHNACAYCPYGDICHSEFVEGRRDYAAMSAQKFWESVEMEVNRRG